MSNDIDFDEIDKAVNSMIAPAGPSPAPVSAPIIPQAPTPTVASAPTVASNPVSLAGQRSSGRFMDVIHPSADMRSTTPPVATTSVVTSVPAVGPEQSRGVTTGPRPVFQPISTPTPVEFSQPALETPFISGAKVEKRPLGTFSFDPSALGPRSTELDTSKPADDVVAAPPAAANEPIPAELQNDLLSIESDSTTTHPTSTILPDRQPEPLPEPEPEPEKPIEQPAGPTSIVQQYREQPSTGDQTTGAIYDTNVYHKALANSDKKKSGWMWILWILLLLIVGAGAGAGTYFYILPLL